jgi:hypothetical protein
LHSLLPLTSDDRHRIYLHQSNGSTLVLLSRAPASRVEALPQAVQTFWQVLQSVSIINSMR